MLTFEETLETTQHLSDKDLQDLMTACTALSDYYRTGKPRSCKAQCILCTTAENLRNKYQGWYKCPYCPWHLLENAGCHPANTTGDTNNNVDTNERR